MEIKEINKKGQKPIAQLSGEMTIYNVKQVLAELLDYMTQYSAMRIDLSEVTKIDSAGFQLLLFIKLEFKKNHKQLIYVKHSEAVLHILELYGGFIDTTAHKLAMEMEKNDVKL